MTGDSQPARHPHDGALLMSVDDEPSNAKRLVIDAHVAGCPRCRSRRTELETALVEATSVYAAQTDDSLAVHSAARTRLVRALDDAAGSWQRSWFFRLRMTIAASPLAFAVPALLLMTLVTVQTLRLTSVDNSTAHRQRLEGMSLPIASLTPGATVVTTAAELCSGKKPIPIVSEAVRREVISAYGMEAVSPNAYELDALITPELGGSADARNLWPQRYNSPVWNARVKDEIEHLLPALVCRGDVDLSRAQQEIAANWIATYKKYFHTTMPLQAHMGPRVDDDRDDDVGIVSAGLVTATADAILLTRPR